MCIHSYVCVYICIYPHVDRRIFLRSTISIYTYVVRRTTAHEIEPHKKKTPSGGGGVPTILQGGGVSREGILFPQPPPLIEWFDLKSREKEIPTKRQVQPNTDRGEQNLEITSITFPMIDPEFYPWGLRVVPPNKMVLMTNSMRFLVCLVLNWKKKLEKNLKILCHRICNRLYHIIKWY